jgi:hypothetical protein
MEGGPVMGKFIEDAIDKHLDEAVEKLVPLLVKQLSPILAKSLLALMPVIAAAVAKAITEQLKAVVPGLSGAGALSLPDLAEKIRNEVNRIPDIDIPVISDIFDLSEFLKDRIR